jgi:hypothetical protein
MIVMNRGGRTAAFAGQCEKQGWVPQRIFGFLFGAQK